MRLNGRQRLEREPHLYDFSQWPYIDVLDLPVNKRKGFLRNRKIMMLFLSGVACNLVAMRCGVHPSFISYLLNRCLGGLSNRSPALTAGLVPFNNIVCPARALPLSVNQNTGARGAFQLILANHPDIREQLDKIILAFVRRDRRAENLLPGRFHREFLRLLRERNWPTNQYPFDRDRLGSETCRKYFHKRVDELRLISKQTKGDRIITPKSKYAYEEVQIDAWLVDLTTSVDSINLDVALADHIIPVKLSRFTVYLATDVATDCRLSYHIALTAHPSKEDVLAVIEKIHLPTERTITTKGIEYLPGAGFPAQLGEVYEHVGIQMIRLDNALAHHAGAVREYVCDVLGATLNLGIPGQPKARGAVEHAFDELAGLARRFPSTTGNSPVDRLKESSKRSKIPPETKLHEFEDILDVTLASYNASNRQIAGGSSPLDLIKYQMDHCYLPLCFSGVTRKRSAFLKRKECSVKFLKNEQRAPFINFQSLRYGGRCLTSSALLGKTVMIEYDIRDIRILSAYTLEGKFLGELRAPMTRQHYPLSLQTFRKIKKRSRDSGSAVAGTVDGYFLELADESYSPKSNLELVRVAREIQQASIDNNDVIKPINPEQKSTSTKRIGGSNKILSWADKLSIARRKAS